MEVMRSSDPIFSLEKTAQPSAMTPRCVDDRRVFLALDRRESGARGSPFGDEVFETETSVGVSTDDDHATKVPALLGGLSNQIQILARPEGGREKYSASLRMRQSVGKIFELVVGVQRD